MKPFPNSQKNLLLPNHIFVNCFAFLSIILISFNVFAEEIQIIQNTEGSIAIENALDESPEDKLEKTSEENGNQELPSAIKKNKKRSTSFYEDFRQQQEEALAKTRKAVDQNQENVSQRLNRFSNYIDKFFAEENYIEESTGSRMRVSITNEYQKYSDPTFQPRISLLLALPNTQNRWRIRFQSNDELEATEDNNSDTSLIDSLSETTYSTAISGIIKTSELVDIRVDAGIKFRTPIDPFTNLRIRRSFLLGKTEIDLTEVFQWRDSEGKTAASALNIKYPFSLKYFFRSWTEIIYWDIDSYWTQSQSFTLYQKLNQRSVLAYATGVHAQDEDSLHLRKKHQVNDYWIELRYRKNFYKDWLFYQISPGLIRPRDYEFETLPRLELKLEMLYGNL